MGAPFGTDSETSHVNIGRANDGAFVSTLDKNSVVASSSALSPGDKPRDSPALANSERRVRHKCKPSAGAAQTINGALSAHISIARPRMPASMYPPGM